MDRIDPSIGQPGMTPLSRPTLLGNVYAPTVQREAIRQEGTLARIGPAADTFEPTAANAPAASPKDASPTRAASRAAALVAAKVPGGIDFTEPSSAGRATTNDASQSVPLYRHPADRNTVATAVHAGRILDVNG